MKKILLLLLVSFGLSAQQAVDVPVSFTVPVQTANGGTGLTSLTANRILYGGATNTYSTNASLNFNGTGLQVGNGTMFGTVPMEMSRTSLGSDFYIRNNLATGTSNIFLVDGIGLSSSIRFALYGSSFASSGISQANTGALFTSNTSIHLNVGTFGNAELRFWANNTRWVTLNQSGRMFLGGSTAPTAVLHLRAGAAGASDAPLKFTSGTNLTTAEAGAMEYDGTNLFFTRTGTTRESIITVNSVNSVSPTSPNRTLTVVIDGTTYYIHAKTTND